MIAIIKNSNGILDKLSKIYNYSIPSTAHSHVWLVINTDLKIVKPLPMAKYKKLKVRVAASLSKDFSLLEREYLL